MDLVTISKVGDTQGTAYGFACTSNGTFGHIHCGITEKTVQLKQKTPEELKQDADMAQRLKEDPWAAYVTDPQGNVTKYNVDGEMSGTVGGYQGTYSLREGFSGGHVLNLPDPIGPSADVQVCVKKAGPKSKEEGTTFEGHSNGLTSSYNPTEGKFCAGITSEEGPGISSSTPVK